jgi:tripartite-type tricarboxylate transporter receptor subunit TctC
MSRLWAALACCLLATAAAGASEDFYKGKQVALMVGSAAGSVNDSYARLLARHLGRHIPGNPAIIVQNVPGASGVTAATQLFNTRARDGTVIAHVQRTLLLDPLLLSRTFPYDILQFNWLGSLNRETNVLIVAGNSKVKTLDDAKTHEAVLAAAAPDSDGVLYPKLMNRFLGTRFKVVPGYSGDADMMLAIERGEAEGRGGVPWSAIKISSADKLRDGRIRLLLQLGMQRSPELPDTPNLLEYVKDDGQKRVFEILFSRQEMGRPVVAPPEVPAERVKLLRAAVAATTKDPQFLDEAKRLNFDVDLMDGEEMQTLLARLYALPKETVEETKRSIAAATENR